MSCTVYDISYVYIENIYMNIYWRYVYWYICIYIHILSFSSNPATWGSTMENEIRKHLFINLFTYVGWYWKGQNPWRRRTAREKEAPREFSMGKFHRPMERSEKRGDMASAPRITSIVQVLFSRNESPFSTTWLLSVKRKFSFWTGWPQRKSIIYVFVQILIYVIFIIFFVIK